MDKVFITGHRNPDMDSVCSAYGYAVLKNQIDPTNDYVAVRCGHLSKVIKAQFDLIGITPPPYMANVHPKVDDVMRTTDVQVQCSSPIYDLVKIYGDTKPSVVPLFSGSEFSGLLSIDDISAWFLKENADERPIYDFNVENFRKVIPGTFIHRGGLENFKAPLIAGAMEFNLFCQRLEKIGKPVVVLGYHDRHIQYAIDVQVPAIIITGTSAVSTEINLKGYQGTIFVTQLDTAETLRRMRMTPPVSVLMGMQGKSLQISDFFDDARDALTNSKLRGLAVYDSDKWCGFVTRRCFLKKPRYDVILVDHNEPEQSIPGLETARVREIIDHHRLAAPKTDVPIFIDAEPLGSTCTIVFRLFQRNNIEPDTITAKVLLSGIISDTVMLKSPTTTFEDYTAADQLCLLAGEEDLQVFGERLFRLSDSLSDRDPHSVIESDLKLYDEKGIKFGIGQCEVTNLEDARENSQTLLKTLDSVKESYALDWAMLLVTDVFHEESILLCTPYRLASRFSYESTDGEVYCSFILPGVLSRKKQLLPEVLRVIDET